MDVLSFALSNLLLYLTFEEQYSTRNEDVPGKITRLHI